MRDSHIQPRLAKQHTGRNPHPKAYSDMKPLTPRVKKRRRQKKMMKRHTNGALLGVKNHLCHLGWPMKRKLGSSTRGRCSCCSCSGCSTCGRCCCCCEDPRRTSAHQVLPSLPADNCVPHGSSGVQFHQISHNESCVHTCLTETSWLFRPSLKVFVRTKARLCMRATGGWQCTRVGAQANIADISNITAATRSGDVRRL
jgi:hypothetical protein